MPCWTSPWPVAAPLDAHLRAAGLKRCQERLEALPEGSLILYSPPDGLLAAGLASAQDAPTPQQLATTYRQLQTFYGRHRLIAGWRLQALTPEAIRQWLEQASPPRGPQPFPEPEPLPALLAKTLLDGHPHLLEAYLDLELIAELAGGAPDTAYPRRLTKAIADSRTLLEHCWLPYQRNQALRQDLADQSAREDALASENQQAREAETLLRVQLDQAHDAEERLTQATHIREARLAQLEQTLATQVSRLLRREEELQQVHAERDEALAIGAELQPRLAAREEELQRAREADAEQQARIEALDGEKRRAREEADERLQRLLHVLDEHERLFLDNQDHKAHLLQLEEQLSAQAVRIDGLEADLDQARSACDGSELERTNILREKESLLSVVDQLQLQLKDQAEALLQAHAAAEGHREALARENQAALARQSDLQHLLAAHEQEARQARDAEVRLLDRVGLLERENQRIREESEATRLQLVLQKQAQARRELAKQSQGSRITHLEDTIAAQATRIAGLEADLARVSGERDQVRQHQEEASRQARATEVALQGQVQALEVKTGQASEETRRLTAQLHHLQEELEQIFLQGQAGDALIAAQHQQLQRAQALMSRLLVQATQSLIPAQAVSVEVLPTHPTKVIPGSSQRPEPGRQGRSARLLRRFWSP